MPFSSGTFTIITQFAPSTTIRSSEVNGNLADIATGLSACIIKDGSNAMTGQFKAAAGSVSAPSYTFDGDLNTGLYRAGADEIRLATGGLDAMKWDSAQKTWALGAFDVTGIADFHGVTTFTNTGVHILDTDASHDLIIKPGTNLTADRTLTITTGDADRTLTLSGNATISGTSSGTNTGDEVAASDTVAGKIEIAVQSEMEAASDATRAVVPARQHFHPGHPKFWGYVTVSAGTPTLQTSYNITSITDTSTGILGVTIATDFSDANWPPVANASGSAATDMIAQVTSQAAGSFTISAVRGNGAVNADPNQWSFAGLGDQ